MGGKSKQSQRTKNNVRPSSSGRSAELLNNAVRIDPGLVTTSSGKVLPGLFPTLAAPLDAGLNPDFSLCLKKLNKKDPITKTKALQELFDLVKKGSVDDVVATLPAWTHYYRLLTIDTDHKVREATQVTHGAVVWACGRRIAPHLKQLVPVWLQAQYDEYAPCAAAARASLTSTFPENKLPDVITFCMSEVMTHLLDNLTGNAEAALSKKNLSPEEKELQQARVVTASLLGLEYFVQHLAPAHDAWLWPRLARLLQPAFWNLPARGNQLIRASWYGALGRIIARFGNTFGAAYGQRAAGELLQAGGGAQQWGCLLVLLHHVQDWHTWLDKKELLIKRIIDVLENGGWGDAKHLSSMLLPLLANLPQHLLTKEFYESFFNAIFIGLEKKCVVSSKSERQSWITSLSECLRYLTVQQNDFVVEVATAVHRTWLERILVNPYDSQTTNNLIKHSATSMAALVKYWLKQSKEANEDKYDQLVRNFWQNVGSTIVAQIDKLSTEHNDITSLIEGHILLLHSLKTSFSQDVKKVKSIKFNDEQQAEAVENVEATQQCDASITDRFNHNLNEAVQKICAHYFEFANKKQVANSVFAPLITLLVEFDDKNLFIALARHFNADSVFGLYDKVLRDWLAGDTMRCKAVADIVFRLVKHLPENEQEAMLDSFKQFPPSVVEWCISLSLSHPHCSVPAVKRWLRGDLVEGSLVAVCKRMINDDDSKSRSLLLMCLANDEQGEMMISPSSVSKLVGLVSSALSPAAASLERLAGAACALCSELSAAECSELALALFLVQLHIPRGDPRLRPETWREARGAWQAAAGAPRFRVAALRALHDTITQHGDNLNIERIEHIASLCPYLLPQLDETRLPEHTGDAATLTKLLFAFRRDSPAQTFALRHDCIQGNLNCPFDDDNEHIRSVVEESSRTDVKELTKTDAVSFASDVLFRAAFLRALATRRDEEERPWCGELLRDQYLEEQLLAVLSDHAVLCSLHDGYAFWPHYDVISRAKQHLAATLDDVIADMPTHTKTSTLAHLASLAATRGYYWSYASKLFRDKVVDTLKDVTAGEGSEAASGDVRLDEIVTGNGYFHTLQADTRSSQDPGVSLRTKYQVMLRSFYLAHAHSDVIDEAFVREAAAGWRSGDADVIVAEYYRHQHTMLYDSDTAPAQWRQVVSNAAAAEYLAAMVGAAGWDAPAPLWDFATISLCSLTAALRCSLAHWGSPKTALLGRAVLALLAAVQSFVRSVRGRSERRRPPPHVAQLPREWDDIFAPDLHYNLLSITLTLLESASERITVPQAAFISALLTPVRELQWRLLPADLALGKLLAAGAGALARPAHPAYRYLAHALLHAAAGPLVSQDAETLAAWTEHDESDTPRARLALSALQPALTELQALVDTALDPLQVGSDACSLEPGSDSHGLALGYLLLADAAFSACQLAGGDLVHHYLELFREARHAELLVTASLRLLPPAVAAHAHHSGNPPPPTHAAHWFLTNIQFTLHEPSSSLDVGRLACRGLWHAARWAGGATRGWWGAAGGRPARALERVLRAFVSPALVRDQLAAVSAGAHTLDDAEVTVHQSTSEVSCVYRVEERSLELTVALGAAHPLPLPRVASLSAPAHNTHWLAMYLAYQNGTVLSALRMWTDTVSRRVQAAPQCYICYCRLHPTTGRLPNVPCHQCRNKFHSHCLRKWFSTSSKSNCPLCRATF